MSSITVPSVSRYRFKRRNSKGELSQFEFVVDTKTREILEEHLLEPPQVSSVSPQSHVDIASVERFGNLLKERGHIVEIKDGVLHNLHTPKIERYIYAFLEQQTIDFPGYDEFQAAYLKDLAKLGADCLACDQAAVRAKYSDKLRIHLKLLPEGLL